MKIDNTSLFFNVKLAPGKPGGTSAWGTSVGQSKPNNYRIDTNKQGIFDLIIGLNYRICSHIENLDISKGSKSRELLLFSVFDKVYVNNWHLEDTKFILLLVKEHSENHEGRIIFSYPPYAKYKRDNVDISNEIAYKKIAEQLNCVNGCWFCYDISIINQDELHFNVIVLDTDSEKIYNSSEERSIEWSIYKKYKFKYKIRRPIIFHCKVP
jgi:hypothetical protein